MSRTVPITPAARRHRRNLIAGHSRSLGGFYLFARIRLSAVYPRWWER